MNLRKSGFVHSCLLVSAITFISKGLSFFRDMLLARYFGASLMSDVILTCTTVLLVVTTFLRSSFAAAYLPVATDMYLNKKKAKYISFFSSMYGAAFSFGLIFLIIEVLFLDDIIHVFMPGIVDDGFYILREMMIIQLPLIPLSFLVTVNNGNLNMLNKYGIAEMSTGMVSLFYVVYLLWFKQYSTPCGISLSVVLAYMLVFLLGYRVVFKANIVRCWSFDYCVVKKDLKPVFVAMIPFMIAAGAREINVMVDKAIASLLEPGSITMQSYASKMTVTETGIIATAISLVVFSKVAMFNTLKNREELNRVVTSGVMLVNTLMVPCCVFTIVFSKDIIAAIFGHGQFSEYNILVTANTMVIYAWGMLGAGIESVLLNTMYAMKYRAFPTMVNIVSIIMNVVLNLLMYEKFGIYGLAIASSFVALAKVPIYFKYVDNNIVSLTSDMSIGKDFFRVLVSSLIVGAIGECAYAYIKAMFASNMISLCIIGGGYVVLCFLIMWLINGTYAIRFIQYLKK